MDVIICDCHLSDGTWKDVLSYIAGLTNPPAVVVTSSIAGRDLRAEVQGLGGYDVLTKPFAEEEVWHVLSAAWKHQTEAFEHAPT
jgi:CheY-like chemotaxis protein